MYRKGRALLLGLPLLSLAAGASAPLVFGTGIWVGVAVFFVTGPTAVAVIVLLAPESSGEDSQTETRPAHGRRDRG